MQGKEFLSLNNENYISFLQQRYRNKPPIPRQLQEAIIKKIAKLDGLSLYRSSLEGLIEKEIVAYNQAHDDTTTMKRSRFLVENHQQNKQNPFVQIIDGEMNLS